jgi:hypothetical protein
VDGQGIVLGDDLSIGGPVEAVVTKLQELERRLKEEPANLGLRVVVAGALREAGRLVEAIALYRSVAIAYRDQGRPQQAIAVCHSILELAPDDARCHALLAALGETESEPTTRRSWADLTPLPAALPYHVADPTVRLRLPSEAELPTTEDAPTRPGTADAVLPEVSGIANAARRISASLIGVRIHADEAISLDMEADEPGPDEARFEAGFEAGPDGVPQLGGDEAEEDYQTRPRDLPHGLRRPWPPVPPPQAARAVGPAYVVSTDSSPPWGEASETEAASLSGPALLSSAFFAPLPAERRAAVLARFSRRTVPPGSVVIRRNEPSPSFVLVARGRLDVRGDRAGAVVDLGTLGPGEHIGEAPLLSRAPARVSVIAATEAELLLLTPRDFFDIAGAFPELWAALKEAAERRTREHAARLA